MTKDDTEILDFGEEGLTDDKIFGLEQLREQQRKDWLIKVTNLISVSVIGVYLLLYTIIVISSVTNYCTVTDTSILSDLRPIVLIVLGFYFGGRLIQ